MGQEKRGVREDHLEAIQEIEVEDVEAVVILQKTPEVEDALDPEVISEVATTVVTIEARMTGMTDVTEIETGNGIGIMIGIVIEKEALGTPESVDFYRTHHNLN